MRGKKLSSNNPIIYTNPMKLQQTRSNNRLRLKDIKSQQSKLINHQNINHNKKINTQNINKKVPVIQTQCQIQLKNRQNYNYIPIKNNYHQSINKNIQYPIINRFQKAVINDDAVKIRNNHFIDNQNQNQNIIRNHSHQRIPIFSAQPNSRATSRSSNNSVKKKGIQVTKTLLRKISGMYSDKDFQNKSTYSNKSNSRRQEMTGIITSSGRVLYDLDEYQISDFDIKVNNLNHINYIEHNPLSFRDSSTLEHSNDRIRLPFKKNQVPKNRIIYEHLVKNSFNPPSQLNKIKSQQYLNSKSSIQSFVVGQQPPKNQNLKRRPIYSPQQEYDKSKYLIQSKNNKTMDELSVKQSMIFGFDNYYQ